MLQRRNLNFVAKNLNKKMASLVTKKKFVTRSRKQRRKHFVAIRWSLATKLFRRYCPLLVTNLCFVTKVVFSDEIISSLKYHYKYSQTKLPPSTKQKTEKLTLKKKKRETHAQKKKKKRNPGLCRRHLRLRPELHQNPDLRRRHLRNWFVNRFD